MLRYIPQMNREVEIPYTGFPLYREPEDLIFDKLEEIQETLEELIKLLEKIEDEGFDLII